MLNDKLINITEFTPTLRAHLISQDTTTAFFATLSFRFGKKLSCSTLLLSGVINITVLRSLHFTRIVFNKLFNDYEEHLPVISRKLSIKERGDLLITFLQGRNHDFLMKTRHLNCFMKYSSVIIFQLRNNFSLFNSNNDEARRELLELSDLMTSIFHSLCLLCWWHWVPFVTFDIRFIELFH